MPICIACSTPVKNLYTTYSKADDRSLGKGVRLTQCPHCKRFADKYVEHDFVVLFIDLVLIKPQVYRHLLFNRLGRSDDKLDPSILRLGTLLVLFDVYITWARIEKFNPGLGPGSDDPGNGDGLGGGEGMGRAWALSEAPILTQYLFFLTINVLATVAQHGIIRFLARLVTKRMKRKAGSETENLSSINDNGEKHTTTTTTSTTTALTPGQTSPAAISTALLVSSCTKLFPILLVIWPTAESNQPTATPQSSTSLGGAFVSLSSYVGWAVLLNNIEALLILLNCGYIVATGLAFAGMCARWFVEKWALELVGLYSPSARELGFLADVVSWLLR
jgi:lipid intermediate transporter